MINIIKKYKDLKKIHNTKFLIIKECYYLNIISSTLYSGLITTNNELIRDNNCIQIINICKGMGCGFLTGLFFPVSLLIYAI